MTFLEIIKVLLRKLGLDQTSLPPAATQPRPELVKSASRRPSPADLWSPRPSPDQTAKAILSNYRPLLHDGPIAVEGLRIGWKRVWDGRIGAIFVNEQTGHRTLWAVEPQTSQPRFVAALSKTEHTDSGPERAALSS
jgi:hypothetical protein